MYIIYLVNFLSPPNFLGPPAAPNFPGAFVPGAAGTLPGAFAAGAAFLVVEATSSFLLGNPYTLDINNSGIAFTNSPSLLV